MPPEVTRENVRDGGDVSHDERGWRGEEIATWWSRSVLPGAGSRSHVETRLIFVTYSGNTLGFSSECSRNEVLVWTVGELESGESRTVLFDAGVSSDTNGGEILRLRGVASASRGIQQVFSANFGLDTEPVMSLGLSEENGPAASGLSYTYFLDYGARFGRGGGQRSRPPTSTP
jgi:hypothetical protein